MPSEDTLEQRLRAEHAALQALQSASSVFSFEATGDPPTRFIVRFRGKGIARAGTSSAPAEVELAELHECDIRLPYSYPQRPPDLRWKTAIFHPNVSFSGFLRLAEIGLPWQEDIGLDTVCERLWDVARMAYVNLEQASNYAAKNWFEHQQQLRLPLDARPLRDGSGGGHNVVSYQRRQGGGVQLASSAAGSGEVLFIGEDTPLPPQAAPPRRRRSWPRGNDDDVLYIGDE